MARNAPTVVPADRLPMIALLSANAVSLVGNRLTLVAVPWFVLQTTGSATRTGVTAAIGALAYILAAFFGGALVDRFGFARTSVRADIASGVTLAVIPLLHHTVGLQFWQLLALVFLSTFCNTPGTTARQSMLPDLAARAAMPLERANAAVQTIGTFARLVGPALAGLLIAVIGTSDVLWLDAATFAVSAGIVAALVPSGTAQRTPDVQGNPLRRYVSELRAGIQFLRHDPLIMALVTSSTVGNFLAAALFSVILPVYARAAFGTAFDLGLMLSAFGGGALIGTLLTGMVAPGLPRRTLYLGAAIVGTIPRLALIGMPPLVVIVGALAVAGIGNGLSNPVIFTAYQERVPAALRGRVFGTIIAVNTIADPLALLLTGSVLDRAGLSMTIIGVNALSLATVGWIVVNPAFRALGRRRV